MQQDLNIIRDKRIVEKLVIVDGLPGNGKSLFGVHILPSLERVEIYSHSEILETICALNFLKKLDLETATNIVRLFVDRKLYEHMMGRKVNFRPSDLTSVFNYPNPSVYFNRLFEKGNKFVIEKVKKQKPILNIQTHNMLAFSEPILNGLKDKVYFLEIVRHPAFMFKQIYTSAISDLVNNVRNWTVHVKFNEGNFPFYVSGYENEFSNSNNFERAVLFIHNYCERLNIFKEYNKSLLKNILTIAFEDFVYNPKGYIETLCKWLDTKVTNKMEEVLKKANVPRRRIADVADMEVYRECGGWSKSIENFNDRDEIDMRINWVKSNVSQEVFNKFEVLCDNYEKTFWKPNT